MSPRKTRAAPSGWNCRWPRRTQVVDLQAASCTIGARQSTRNAMNQDPKVCAGDDARRPKHDEVEMRVYAAQMDLLYALAPITLRMAVFLATVLALAIAPVVPWQNIAAWY